MIPCFNDLVQICCTVLLTFFLYIWISVMLVSYRLLACFLYLPSGYQWNTTFFTIIVITVVAFVLLVPLLGAKATLNLIGFESSNFAYVTFYRQIFLARNIWLFIIIIYTTGTVLKIVP